jgi:hypothetical protein
MASVSLELQKAIYEALTSDDAVSALVGDRVYDGTPSNQQFPYITFGPNDRILEDLECISASTETLQLDVWSRDQGRLGPCKAVCDAVRNALHLAGLELQVNALVRIRVDRVRVFKDSDGVTAHGVVTIEADLEEV